MLPDDLTNLILDYAASMEEYDRRMRVHAEMHCDHMFREIRRLYVNLYTIFDVVPLLESAQNDVP